MKLTTTELKRLIQEEYQKLNTEADDKKSAAEARTIMMDLRDLINQAGIDDVERDIILDVVGTMINFAGQRSLNSPTILEPLNLAITRMKEAALEPEEKS